MSSKEVLIEANRSEKHYWIDIWHYKDLLIILAKRDILVRYKQTIIGAAWGFVRPLFTLIGFAFIFTKLIGQNQQNVVPYPVMAFSGILIWTFFSNLFIQVSNSLVTNTNLISKVYFPRIIMPLSSVFVVMVDFLMALLLFAILVTYFKTFPSFQILYLPLSLFHGFLLAFSIGLIFATLNIKYRDFGQLGPFIVQFGLFICPVAYSHETVVLTPKMAFLYNLNPVVGLIDSFRWAILPPGSSFPWDSFIPSVIITLILLIIAVTFFRKREDKFVDFI
ncbi:MAG: ABC transporter permease [Bacteroidota bacterium]